VKILNFLQKPSFQWLIITCLILCQLIRLINFITVYGGLEHDSGWALGTSRSLAETGRYAAMVNTMADPTPGGMPNIYGRYNVQDEEGRVYFAPDSIGPGSIIPNAVIIKVFGAGFWQYRLGPLLFFFIALLLSSYLLFQAGGLLPVIITHLFLFFYPHLIVFLGYEAMGEIYGLAYILLAFVLLLRGIRARKYRQGWFLASGIAAGLTLITKMVGLLALSGLGMVMVMTLWEKRMLWKDIAIVVFGAILPFAVWELTHFLTLTLLFDFETYLNFKAQFFGFFLQGGSGIDAQGRHDLAFMWYKLLIMREISLANPAVSLLFLGVVFASGPFLCWRFYRDTIRRNIIIFLWLGWLTTSLWFVPLAKTGWVRHYWYALIFAVFLLSLLTTYFWQHFTRPVVWLNRGAALGLSGLIVLGFAGQITSPDFFTADRLVERWYQQHLTEPSTRIPWIIIPRAEQEAALAVLNQLPNSARVFYPEGHKSAEMAVLSGRIFYPIERRALMLPSQGDVVVVGPSLVSPWAKLIETSMTVAYRDGLFVDIINEIKRQCPRMLLENNYYIICALD